MKVYMFLTLAQLPSNILYKSLYAFTFKKICWVKKVREYDQEIAQSQTADKPMAHEGEHHNNHKTP